MTGSASRALRSLLRVVPALLLALLALVAPFAVAAERSADPLAAPVSGAPLAAGGPVVVDPSTPRGFLWEARRNDQRVLLYGTIHFGVPGFWPPTAGQLARLDEADVVALEADPTQAARGLAALQASALYAEGQPGLDQRLAPSLRERVDRRVAQMGLAPERAWRMRPWMLAQTLVAVEAMRGGLNAAYSAESWLLSWAQGRGRRIEEIEGIERQLRLFDGLDDQAQQRMLAQTLDQFDSGEAQREMRALVQSWAQGDAEAMEQRLARMRASSSPSDAFMVATLLDGRHPAMLAYIERVAASRKVYLVAVGALHWFGPNGLIEMLRGRGWTIAPID